MNQQSRYIFRFINNLFINFLEILIPNLPCLLICPKVWPKIPIRMLSNSSWNLLTNHDYVIVLQVSGLTNWLLTSPTIILINLQVIVICCQCSTISIILLTNIGISIIQISFIPSSDHCWFCSGRCIQERSRSIASYLIYPNPNSVSVQIIFNEINALFLQLNQNGTSDCHFICRFYA